MIVNKKTIQSRPGKGVAVPKTKKPTRRESLPSIEKPSKPSKATASRKSPTKTRGAMPSSIAAIAVDTSPSVQNTEPEDITAWARRLLQQTREGDHNCGNVHIKFNHYNKSFPIHNGVLQWTDVDAAYCFSFVYRGNYTRDIVCLTNGDGRTRMLRDDLGDFFVGLAVADAYDVVVEEDAIAGVGAEGLRVNDKPLFAMDKASGAALTSGNAATRLLTKDLKNMRPEMLGSDEARDILARRDIEDVLFA
ncbi:Aste57867_13531 [Aphanomyces stellatus]|uniref:Aste57867_13531 protein n=1 Tax=Aphanomyces stellatus TaxID=120398 RepID=A0A485KYM4_9STRA|nr:hypothetical protein As57867_013481 [Aphanomyces stellatus]VFT90369.1 Aste57867_13531 [Aphanomyces stellatus]